MRAHMCVAAGRWQCTAAHRLWRLECPRQQCWSLTCVLGPQQTAAVATSSSLLLPDSVKPAVQRGVQSARGLVPPEAERVQTR